MDDRPATEDDKQLIRNALVVNHKEIFEKLLDRVKRVLALDQNGRAHLRVPRDKVNDSLHIALQLVGRNFAHTIDSAPNDTMSVEEISRSTGISYKTVTARLAGLKQRGWIESDVRGEYRIVYMRIEEIMSEVEQNAGGTK